MNRNLIFSQVLLTIAALACKKVTAGDLPGITPSTGKKWVVTTGAGNGIHDTTNENGVVAGFGSPGRLTTDVNGNLYVLDASYPVVRKITPAGFVTRYAETTGFGDRDGISANFNIIKGWGIERPGNIYAADVNHHRIRKISFE